MANSVLSMLSTITCQLLIAPAVPVLVLLCSICLCQAHGDMNVTDLAVNETTTATTTLSTTVIFNITSSSDMSNFNDTSNSPSSDYNSGSEYEDADTGKVAGIVIGVIGGLALAGALIAFCVYKQYVHRNVKSMNFDNPVYRKTTEDQFSLEKNQYQPTRSYPVVSEETLEPLTNPGTNEFV